MLLGQLKLEGRKEEMDRVLSEMRERGIEPNEHTTKVLQRSEHALGRMRSSQRRRAALARSGKVA